MITNVTLRGDFIHVAVGCTDANGAAIDPSAAEAHFFRVSQLSGDLYPDESIGVEGVLTLAKKGGETGFYGAALELGGVDPGQFVVLFKATIGGTNTIAVDYLELGEDPHLYRCVANAVYANGANTLTVNAWLTDHGVTMVDPLDCTFTLYDDSGAEVFAGLTSNSPDGRGVFKLTKSAPGLSYDKSYYGKVEIYDGLRSFSSLVGLVTVE